MKTALTVTLFLTLSTSLSFAGGVPESELPKADPVPRAEEPVKTSPELEKALEDARKAYTEQQRAPQPKSQPVTSPKTSVQTSPQPITRSGWQLKSGGDCAGLDSLTSKVGNFATPQEYARKMQQRGFQAFVLDLGDGQVKVKVPDQNQNLLFVESGHCP